MSKQGIEVICYGINPQTCQCVFENEEEARRTIGYEFNQLSIKHNIYFLSDYAIYGQQARALSELMFQCLYEPPVFNNSLIHNERKMFGFVQVRNTGHGQFVTKPKPNDGIEIPNMPSVREMVNCLKEQTFFSDVPSIIGMGIAPYIKLLNLVLEGKCEQPDETFSSVISAYKS